MTGTPVTPAERSIMASMRDEGMKVTEIAEKLGRHEDTIAQHLNGEGRNRTKNPNYHRNKRNVCHAHKRSWGQAKPVGQLQTRECGKGCCLMGPKL